MASRYGYEFEAPHTARTWPTRAPDDPLATARGFMLGVAIGVAFWGSIILVAVIASA